ILHPPQIFKNQVKSHFYAIEKFKRAHNIITIIDSDNIVHPEYLNEMDYYFNRGFKAVQGVRKAKNYNSIYACLDAINELYYLLYDRIVLFSIGSSSMLSGSGMAFTTELFKECLGPLNTEGAGFDKVLQNQILSRDLRIAFADKAIVYDEKTADPSQLVKQRARWNNTWFRYFKYSLQLMGKGIKNFSLNQFLYGFLLFRPPLFILIIICLIITVVNIFISIPAFLVWVALLSIFTIGFLNALIQLKADKRLYGSLLYIPKFMFLQVLSLFKAKKANELSVATEHSFHKAPEEI
ncbi:MAG: glycosyltransferase, partial [Ferruginibacter sp.]